MNRRKAARVWPVPTNLTEAAAQMARIGELARTLQRRTASLASRVLDMVARAVAKSEVQEAELGQLVDMLAAYAREHRDALLTKDSKTADLGTGTVSWRMRPPSVTFEEKDEGGIIRRLRRHRLQRCLKKTVTIDKRFLLAALQADPKMRERFRDVEIVEGLEDIVLAPAGFDVKLTAGKWFGLVLPGKLKRPANDGGEGEEA